MKKENQILGIDDQKSKVPTYALIGGGIIIAIAIILFFVFGSSSETLSEELVQEFEETKKVYEQQEIEYTEEDFLSDKEIEEKVETGEITEEEAVEQGSSASQALASVNKRVETTLTETALFDVKAENIKNNIIDQTKEMNKFISTNLGWADQGEDFSAVSDYAKSLVDSMSGSSFSHDENYGSLSSQQAVARYCIAEGLQYKANNGFTGYNSVLKNWMASGHKEITSISTITLTVCDEWWDEVYYSTVYADIVSGGKYYRVHLASQVDNDGTEYFKVLDVQ